MVSFYPMFQPRIRFIGFEPPFQPQAGLKLNPG
jgi:hypothetical protein